MVKIIMFRTLISGVLLALVRTYRYMDIWKRIPEEEQQKVTGILSRKIAEIGMKESETNMEPSKEYGAFETEFHLMHADTFRLNKSLYKAEKVCNPAKLIFCADDNCERCYTKIKRPWAKE